MILYIDTTDFNSAVFAASGEKFFSSTVAVDPQKSYLLASELGKFLNKCKITENSLTKIVVCSGPGSYTGVRIGVVEAQALSLAWNVPVSALKKPKFKMPKSK
jgi:tRNA threonylcarbamoyladenosine biosynthesis protein TsaB